MFFLVLLGISLLIGIIIGAGKAASQNFEASLVKTDPVFAKVKEISHRGSLATTIIFELSDGSRVSLAVPTKDYGTLVVGDTGLLTYHKTVFKSFVREEPIDPALVNQ